ncbi:hypothetical protein BKG82_23065 [Mycobacteroides chelonae]|uniref:Uncharacterized protein n=1 Tax=Mycobacteroides chelonae TaxID=1774 RepID=A0A1S1LL69_MYCCH|nr:hypothetical protein [Mycobacteroides chelonae]OHU51480.1 hypothetical protein BKG82_23065 [Mycobacteroides chelonae]
MADEANVFNAVADVILGDGASDKLNERAEAFFDYMGDVGDTGVEVLTLAAEILLAPYFLIRQVFRDAR